MRSKALRLAWNLPERCQHHDVSRINGLLVFLLPRRFSYLVVVRSTPYPNRP